MKEAVIVSAVRTPLANERGALKDIQPEDLAALVIGEALKRAGVAPEQVEDVIFGQSQGLGRNVSRLALLMAGLPVCVPGITVDRRCTSGLDSINFAAQAIMVGSGEVYVAGGVESMTRQPYMMERPTQAFSRSAPKFTRGALAPPEVGDPPMGITAETLAEKYGISREEQDQLGLRSNQLAIKAIDEGIFKEEIVPVTVPQKKGDPIFFDTDEHPRRDTSMEKMAKLRAVFKKDGTVTAGTSSGIGDGAAAVVVMSKEKAEEIGTEPMARIVSFAVAAVDPNIMGISPVPAVKKALERAGLSLDDIDLIELNEAFAAQALAVIKELKIDDFDKRLNVNGGAIALGHPIACSGCRLMVTLLHEMKKRNAKTGLVTLCGGGGNGAAMIVERMKDEG
jgi:acetyl-CoA C-acetyltransferase